MACLGWYLMSSVFTDHQLLWDEPVGLIETIIKIRAGLDNYETKTLRQADKTILPYDLETAKKHLKALQAKFPHLNISVAEENVA